MEIILDHEPTILEMDVLAPGSYYNYKGKVYIRSYLESTRKGIYQSVFECPWCWTMYKVNGEPYKKSKRIIHRHGAGLGFADKCGHCQRQRVGEGSYVICTTRDVNGNLIDDILDTNAYPVELYQPVVKDTHVSRRL